MAFGTSGSNDVEIKIKVDAQGAITVLDQTGEAIANVAGKAEQSGSSIDNFSRSWTELKSKIDLAKEAFSLISGGIDTVFGILERGSAVDDVATSFKRMSDQAGVTADVFLNQLNTATAQTISNFELQKAAIEAARAGAKPTEFLELTKAARALAEETGGNLTDELNQLSFAFETGMTRALKNKLGVIDLEKAENDLATQLGVTRGELTKEQTVMAARGAILEASKKKTEELGTITKDAGDNVATLSKIVNDASDSFKVAFANNKDLNEALARLGETIKSIDFTFVVNGITAIATAAGKAIKFVSTLGEDLQKLSPKSIGGTFLRGVGDFLGGNSIAAKWLDKTGLGLLTDAYKALAKDGIQPTAEAMEQLGSSAAQSSAPSEKLATALNKVTTAATGTKTTIEEIQKLGPIFGPGNAEGLDEFNRAMDEMSAKAGAEWGQIAGSAFTEFMGAAIHGNSGDIVKALQNIAGSIGSKLGGDLGSSLGQMIGGTFGATFGGPLGASIGSFLGTELVSGIEKLFGSDSASTKARKSADKFFADIFDANRLGVIVDGQLQQIKDLVFQGSTLFGGEVSFGDGSGFDFLKSLPAEAQAAFSGVGTAFELMMGNIEENGGQLAAVFANNIGGSLNNLQLLIQATGKTAEEMGDAVTEAFLDGSLSAGEALSAIQSINQVMTDGIPDGIGQVVQAFDNLKAAGIKGGRALVDALKDIGFEAKENKQSLQDAMAQIAASGKFSAEEIQQVMDALAANGIDSVEELTSATTEQLLPVLALLENQKFPFAEAADDGQKLVDTLNNLPSQKTIDVNIRVKATGDVGALDKVSGGGSGFSNTSTGVKPGNSGSNAPRERPGQSGGGAGING